MEAFSARGSFDGMEAFRPVVYARPQSPGILEKLCTHPCIMRASLHLSAPPLPAVPQRLIAEMERVFHVPSSRLMG